MRDIEEYWGILGDTEGYWGVRGDIGEYWGILRMGDVRVDARMDADSTFLWYLEGDAGGWTNGHDIGRRVHRRRMGNSGAGMTGAVVLALSFWFVDDALSTPRLS